ncbi:hypothetical protein J6590_078531 [Homalodisca vitripennis]|nr:hypothetical protein J6590_078531 [Homalodisca vitripennis]
MGPERFQTILAHRCVHHTVGGDDQDDDKGFGSDGAGNHQTSKLQKSLAVAITVQPHNSWPCS